MLAHHTPRRAPPFLACRAFGYDGTSGPFKAEANGIADSAGLQEGQVIRIPGFVLGTTNSDGSFIPYDPSRAVGDTSPYIPQPPKPHISLWESLSDFNPGDHAEWNIKAITRPWEPQNVFSAIRSAPGATYKDQEVLDKPWLYQLGRTAATIGTAWFSGGYGWGGAMWDGYYTWVQTGDVDQAAKVSGKAAAAEAVTWGINQGVSSYIDSQGLSSTTGTGYGYAYAGNIVATAAGNYAGQQAGVWMGTQEEVNWRQVGGAAAGAAITGPDNQISFASSWQSMVLAFARNYTSNVVSQAISNDSLSSVNWKQAGWSAGIQTGSSLVSSIWKAGNSQQEQKAEQSNQISGVQPEDPFGDFMGPSTYTGGQAWAADLAARRAENLRNMSPTMLAYSLPDPGKVAWNQVQNHPDFSESYGGGSAYIDGLQQSFEFEAAQKNLKLMSAVAAANANDPNLSLNRNQLWAAAGSFVGWGQDSAANSFMMSRNPGGFANLVMQDAKNNQSSLINFYLDMDPASIVAKGSDWLTITSAIGNQGSERAARIAINVEQVARERIFPRLMGLPARGDYGDLYAPGVPSIENAILLPNVAANIGSLNTFTGIVSGFIPPMGFNELSLRSSTAQTLYDVGLLDQASLKLVQTDLYKQREGLMGDIGLSLMLMGSKPVKMIGTMLMTQDALAGKATPFGSPQNLLAKEFRALAAAGSGATIRQLATATTMSRYLVGAAGNAPIDLVKAAGYSAETFTQMYARGVKGLETFMVQRADGTGFDIITAKLGSNGTLSNVMVLDVKNSAGLVDSVTAFGTKARRTDNYDRNLNNAILRMEAQAEDGVPYAASLAQALRQRQFGIGIVTAPGARMSTSAINQITTATGRSPQLLPWLP